MFFWHKWSAGYNFYKRQPVNVVVAIPHTIHQYIYVIDRNTLQAFTTFTTFYYRKNTNNDGVFATHTLEPIAYTHTAYQYNVTYNFDKGLISSVVSSTSHIPPRRYNDITILLRDLCLCVWVCFLFFFFYVFHQIHSGTHHHHSITITSIAGVKCTVTVPLFICVILLYENINMSL